jgi:hypothetical protein
MAADVMTTPAIDEDAPTVTAPSTIQKTFEGWAPFRRLTTSFAPKVSAPWMRNTNTALAFPCPSRVRGWLAAMFTAVAAS